MTCRCATFGEGLRVSGLVVPSLFGVRSCLLSLLTTPHPSAMASSSTTCQYDTCKEGLQTTSTFTPTTPPPIPTLHTHSTPHAHAHIPTTTAVSPPSRVRPPATPLCATRSQPMPSHGSHALSLSLENKGRRCTELTSVGHSPEWNRDHRAQPGHAKPHRSPCTNSIHLTRRSSTGACTAGSTSFSPNSLQLLALEQRCVCGSAATLLLL
jgi:hypothetical protein